MVDPMQNAAMLWTGGKDSSMALYEAVQSGYSVRCLVTFAPPVAVMEPSSVALVGPTVTRGVVVVTVGLVAAGVGVALAVLEAEPVPAELVAETRKS